MSSKFKIPSTSDIYLELDKFKKLCNECHIDVSDQLLEAYEKHGLIYPAYRVKRPPKYLQLIFEQRGYSYCLAVPDRYDKLFKFEQSDLNMWKSPTSPEFDKALSEGHPIDQAYTRSEKFIVKPSSKNFQNWSRYKVKLSKETGGSVVSQRDSLVVHYYSPWQLYLLNEANNAYTLKTNLLLRGRRRVTPYIKSKPCKLKLSEWEEFFESLYLFKFKENLLFSKACNGIEGNFLDGVNAKRFHNNYRTLAKAVYSAHFHERWVDFLRSLCELYFGYQKDEKTNPSKCLKEDIGAIIDLIMSGASKNYKDLVNEVGMIIGGIQHLGTPPLEKIYPDYESYLKRESLDELESAWNYYNKVVPANLTLGKEALKEIIDHAFKHGNKTLLVAIIGIHKEYFVQSYFGNEGLWSYIRSLAIAIEVWVKNLSGGRGFTSAINSLTNGTFNSCLEQLAQACGLRNRNALRINSFSELTNFLSTLSGLRFNSGSIVLPWMEYIVRAYLIRNYAAHHTALEQELFGKNFIEIYHSLLFLVFYAWKVHV